jgi:sulfoxide reductase heme-binding subunit YedZ
MTQRSVVLIKIALWAACLAPLALLVLRAFGYLNGLGANPVEEILNTCGKTGLNLLVATLCVTPLRRWTGINRLVTFRRLLGLFAFFYLSLHFLTYALLDLGLLFQPQMALGTLLVDIAERPYITVGFTALVLLIPLAATSTRAMQRRLGRNWVKLHRLVYVIVVLGLVHYWWQIKSDADIVQPSIYALAIAFLLGVRLKYKLVNAKAAVPPSYQRVEPPQAHEKPGH